MTVKVLVVDDSTTQRMIVSSVFTELAQWQAVTANNGQQGIEAATREPFDLVVTDINMPVLDGIGFVRALRERADYSQTPVIVLTTEDDEERKLIAADLGVCAWMHKPADPESLVELARELIDESAASPAQDA